MFRRRLTDEEQLEALLAKNPLLVLPALTRRIQDKEPLTDEQRIEQHIYMLFVMLYRQKCELLEEEWRRQLLERWYREELTALTEQLIKRAQQEQQADLRAESWR